MTHEDKERFARLRQVRHELIAAYEHKRRCKETGNAAELIEVQRHIEVLEEEETQLETGQSPLSVT